MGLLKLRQYQRHGESFPIKQFKGLARILKMSINEMIKAKEIPHARRVLC